MMLKKEWKVYTIWIAVCEAVGIVAGLLSRSGTEIYNMTAVKPPFSPPSWLFPVVWTILYALMGISAARITLEPESSDRSRGLNLMVAQLIVNFNDIPHEVREVQIHGCRGELHISSDLSQEASGLIWVDEEKGVWFAIQAFFEPEEIIKIAESVQIVAE